jgi:hypothetical protein
MEYHYSVWLGNDLLFINKSGVVSFKTGKELIKVKYRGQDYYKYPKTDKRIAVRTIKNKLEKVVGINF